MIGLDTNVIVRYLVQDDLVQSSKVNIFVEKAIAKGETLFISQIVLCEVVWVLESCYNVTKKELIDILTRILHIKGLYVEYEEVIRKALVDYRDNSRVDFSDCLIGRQNAFCECALTYTFDKNVAKKLFNNFKLIN